MAPPNTPATTTPASTPAAVATSTPSMPTTPTPQQGRQRGMVNRNTTMPQGNTTQPDDTTTQTPANTVEPHKEPRDISPSESRPVYLWDRFVHAGGIFLSVGGTGNIGAFRPVMADVNGERRCVGGEIFSPLLKEPWIVLRTREEAASFFRQARCPFFAYDADDVPYLDDSLINMYMEFGMLLARDAY